MKKTTPERTFISIPLGLLCCIQLLTPYSMAAPKKEPCKIKSAGGEQPEDVCRIIKYLQNFKKLLDRQPPHNVYIIEGETGIGKTTVAQAIAQESGTPLVYREAGELADQAKNIGNKCVKDAYAEAEQKTENGQQPVVLVIDDVEAVAMKDNEKQDGNVQTVFQKLRSKLQSQFTNRAIVTILVTQNLKEIDKSILNRCKTIVYKSTTTEDRKDIFKHYSKKERHDIRETTLNNVAKKHSDFKGRDIRIVFSDARQLANAEDYERIQDSHLTEACKLKQKQFDKSKPSFLSLVKTYIKELFS